jgi:hypothetical protein
VKPINLEDDMEARTTFRGTAASKKGLGVVLLAVIVAIAAMLAIALASASAKPSSAPAIAPGTFVGSAALADRESGQPVGAYVAPSNGHRALP